MRAVELFGTHLRDTHSFITHLKKDVPINLVELIDKGHTLLSQPMQEGWFVRPEAEISVGGIDLLSEEEAKWKPLFKGEWRFLGEHLLLDVEHDSSRLIGAIGDDFKTLNDFAIHCAKAGIPLELNEDYEILFN